MNRDYRPPDRSKYLLREEIAALLSAADRVGPFEGRYLRFMANTGVRPSESNVVRAKDVFPGEHRVRIRTLKQKPDAAGKVRDVFRDVDIAQEYSKDIGKYARTLTQMQILFSRSRVTLWRIFKEAARLAKLPQSYTLYGLRHSRCIYLLEWTGDLPYVSQQMGHSSLDITKVYLHCLPSKRENYVKTKLETF